MEAWLPFMTRKTCIFILLTEIVERGWSFLFMIVHSLERTSAFGAWQCWKCDTLFVRLYICDQTIPVIITYFKTGYLSTKKIPSGLGVQQWFVMVCPSSVAGTNVYFQSTSYPNSWVLTLLMHLFFQPSELVVGFESTSLVVSESAGKVEFCVNLIQPSSVPVEFKVNLTVETHAGTAG